ncbi:MAG: phosphate/phosphite/phosphonate ABC transporter substrate-binding protein [Candidatus Kapabacteria bacterium]|nr:phosphate/phosphite/phosphonate ABC transporter substrate-binding protein [Candidatus Kapabacteria bacterium]
MRIARVYILIVACILGWLTVRPLFVKDMSPGSEKNPIRLMLTPSTDAQAIIRDGDVLAQYLLAETGLHVSVAVPNYYITVVEAFGTERADMAIMNTFSYLLAHSKYGARAVLRVARRYGELTYRGEFIVRANSGIDSLYQLQGRTIAYVDPSSTSGYIYPKEMLRIRGVVPRQEVFANGHNQVVTKVYQGDVDAGAVFFSRPDSVTGERLDARAKIATEHPDVFDIVKVIALTEEIPNDPVVVRKGLPQDVVDKLIAALLRFQETPNGKKSLMTIASVEGFKPSSDDDYSAVRTLVAKYGIDVESAVRRKKR